MVFHEEIKGKIVTVDRLDDMMIQEKNDKIHTKTIAGNGSKWNC